MPNELIDIAKLKNTTDCKTLNTRWWWESIFSFLNLAHFQPIFISISPWKHQKTIGFLMFSRGIKTEHCPEMDSIVPKFVIPEFLKVYLFQIVSITITDIATLSNHILLKLNFFLNWLMRKLYRLLWQDWKTSFIFISGWHLAYKRFHSYWVLILLNHLFKKDVSIFLTSR